MDKDLQLPRRSRDRYTEADVRNSELFELQINGSKVMRCKHTSPHLNGEFMAYFLTEEGKCYFCNCDFRSNGVNLITTEESTRSHFDEA